jgi:hypothetical protein
MRPSRVLVALLTLLLPCRGRHCAVRAAVAADEPRDLRVRRRRRPAQAAGGDEDVSAAEFTRFDLPPGRARPYVLPSEQDRAGWSL